MNFAASLNRMFRSNLNTFCSLRPQLPDLHPSLSLLNSLFTYISFSVSLVTHSLSVMGNRTVTHRYTLTAQCFSLWCLASIQFASCPPVTHNPTFPLDDFPFSFHSRSPRVPLISHTFSLLIILFLMLFIPFSLLCSLCDLLVCLQFTINSSTVLYFILLLRFQLVRENNLLLIPVRITILWLDFMRQRLFQNVHKVTLAPWVMNVFYWVMLSLQDVWRHECSVTYKTWPACFASEQNLRGILSKLPDHVWTWKPGSEH